MSDIFYLPQSFNNFLNIKVTNVNYVYKIRKIGVELSDGEV